jgi:hypothetical protein
VKVATICTAPPAPTVDGDIPTVASESGGGPRPLPAAAPPATASHAAATERRILTLIARHAFASHVRIPAGPLTEIVLTTSLRRVHSRPSFRVGVPGPGGVPASSFAR